MTDNVTRLLADRTKILTPDLQRLYREMESFALSLPGIQRKVHTRRLSDGSLDEIGVSYKRGQRRVLRIDPRTLAGHNRLGISFGLPKNTVDRRFRAFQERGEAYTRPFFTTQSWIYVQSRDDQLVSLLKETVMDAYRL
jgi:hypothetical protein